MTEGTEAISPEGLMLAVARTRDKQAFTALFTHFAPRVKAFLQRGGMPAGTAEELAQEALLTVWRKAELFDPGRASAQAWIYAIARNLKIDALRRNRLPLPEPDPTDREPEPLSDALIDAEQRSRSVRRAIADLPEEQVEILRLAYFEDLSHGEIEKTLGIPLGTVKSRLRLAMTKLSKTLKEEK